MRWGFRIASGFLRLWVTHTDSLHQTLRLLRILITEDVSSAVGEQSFINLQQCLLIVHEQVEQVILILGRKINQSHARLSQLRQPQQWLFEILCFLDCLVDIMKLLARVNLILQSAAHYFLPHFFDALDKKTFQIVLLHLGVGLIWHQFLLSLFVLLYHVFKLPDQLIIIGF